MSSGSKELSDQLDKFFDLILMMKKILLKLQKYKGNPNYKKAFLTKVSEINRESKFLYAKVNASSNNSLKKALNSKLKGSIETIVNYKDPDSSLVEIDYLEDYWPKVEIASKELNKYSISKLKERNIHTEIIEVSEKLFDDQHYAQAIEEAFKKVVLLVKKKTGRQDLDGFTLMSTAFSKNSPILKFNQLSNPIELDEQQGWMHIYQGAVLGIRNVKAHGNIVQKDPIKALEYISLASLLCRRLDDVKS